MRPVLIINEFHVDLNRLLCKAADAKVGLGLGSKYTKIVIFIFLGSLQAQKIS